MRKQISKCITNILIILVMAVFGVDNCCHADQHDGKSVMTQYLVTIGTELDCYFTVELDGRDLKKRSILTTLLTKDGTVKSVNDLVNKLQRELPAITVLQSKENPAVIHLVESSLLHNDSYPLQKDVSIKFNGTLPNLPNALGHSTGGKISRPWFSVSSIYAEDETEIKLNVQDTPVRRVLTDYIPLSTYKRILWISQEVLLDGELVVEITYPGTHMSGVHRDRTALSSIESFTKGEIAYNSNSNSAQVVMNAIDFIKTHMQNGETRQVRWAMLYLGRYKEKSGLPVLLKYLDYQYAALPLLEEAYPAVRALQLMGNIGQDTALEAIKKETDPLKLRLLCQVILGVAGDSKGHTLLDLTSQKITDETQQKRVQEAISKMPTEPLPLTQ